MTGLVDRRIMAVEDNYLSAMEIKTVLQEAGAEVVGPFPTVANARPSLLRHLPDGAALDVNLGVGNSFDLARLLLTREIPFVFFTGYNAAVLPTEFSDVECPEKPVEAVRLRHAVENCCRARPRKRRTIRVVSITDA